jgi:putative GTP pyrophosphokinase
MTSAADAFVMQLRASTPALNKWAAYVVNHVSDMLLAEIGKERHKTFFKVSPSFRLKDEASAVRKQAKKGYKNPFEQMTDLVGARFVVLLRTDLILLEQVMVGHAGWSASRERHYDHEVEADPEVFDYQSIHFLLRSIGDETRDGVFIPDGTVCEVQIRTVLQHAYAELCHDRIYKTASLIPSSAKRLVARCMALMETTDLMFCEAARELEQVSVDRAVWIEFLSAEYFDITKRQAAVNDPICAHFVDVYLHLLNGVKMTDVSGEVASQALRTRILDRATGVRLFASPACILCYWLVQNHHTELLRTWPNEALRSDFEQVCADLGFGLS